MALLDLWQTNRDQLSPKHIQQVIAIAGDGKLRDGMPTSTEFREFLRHVSSELLARYADDCLREPFPDSGLALQDVVNEIGRRLEFQVNHGRYRGTTNQPGHDGLWSDTTKHSIVVEVKTTASFPVNIDAIARYRKTLAGNGSICLDTSSMLVVVGRHDTGDLEAQIRGSRHAWDMRVISIDGLLRMLNLKEAVEDPSLIKRIHDILIPHEFTRLDPIIEIAFEAVADIKQEEAEAEQQNEGHIISPAAFNAACVARIEKHLGVSLVKRTRALFSTVDESTRILCLTSRYYESTKRFWFSFYPHQAEFLKEAPQAYISFGCGDPDTIFVIPFKDFFAWLKFFTTTESPRHKWQIYIKPPGRGYMLITRAGRNNIDISKFMMTRPVIIR